MHMRKAWIVGIITLLLGCITPNLYAREEVDSSVLEKRLIRSEESFQNINMSHSSGPIPSGIVQKAQGILIFRQYGGGFFFGGKGGYGVVIARQRDGHWGSPAFLKSIDGSWGLQIGGQRVDMVLFFMSRESLQVFERGKFRIGVDMGAAAGPVGAKGEGKVGAPVLVYANNAGLYIGVAFEGGILIPDKMANESLYHITDITVPNIITEGRVPFPQAAAGLRGMLENYERSGN